MFLIFCPFLKKKQKTIEVTPLKMAPGERQKNQTEEQK